MFDFVGPNQCMTFVKGNGGPGVQHVAYHTRNLFSTATLIRDHGQAFLQPPIEYYSQVCCQHLCCCVLPTLTLLCAAYTHAAVCC